MKIRDLDMFGMLTIIFSRPVRTIKDLGLNIFRDLNSSNLNLTAIPALNRITFEDFDPNSLLMDWNVSNQTNLTEGVLRI